MDKLCREALLQLQKSIDGDPISRCSEASLATTDPEAALRVADAKLRVFPFKDVDGCWRRLYADAGICKAARLMLEQRPGWLDSAVRQLDMVLIMTGAPLREEMVESLFEGLRQLLDASDQAQSDQTEFDVSFQAPRLEFPVPKSQMSLPQFERHTRERVPHVIKGALTHWPAFEERPWKRPSYLLERTLGGRRLVPVELGRSYTDEDWGQAIVTFGEFLDEYVVRGKSMGYLAQHDLFAQVPALRKDVCVPDFCYTNPPGPKAGSALDGKVKEVDEPLLNAWFGPAGTISPLHTDPYHNVLCQVVGKKYVRLYAPEETAKLYPRGTEGGIDMSNTSAVAVERVEMGAEEDEEHPLFEQARYVETVLEEGDCLYVPVGWWHYVRSLTVSFSVSFWWN